MYIMKYISGEVTSMILIGALVGFLAVLLLPKKLDCNDRTVTAPFLKEHARRNLAVTGYPTQYNTLAQHIKAYKEDGRYSYATATRYAEGIYITNRHVVQDYTTKEINKLSIGGKELKVVHILDKFDLALIADKELTDEEIFKRLYFTKPFVRTEIGTRIFSFGYPVDNLLRMSVGDITSNTISLLYFIHSFETSSVYKHVSAPIYPGMSGGPVVDKKGNLVGINDFTYPYFALPESMKTACYSNFGNSELEKVGSKGGIIPAETVNQFISETRQVLQSKLRGSN